MNNERCKGCARSLVIDPYTVQLYGVALVILLCGIFIVGYFFGKHVATQSFKEEIEQQAFADQIQHSLHVLYNTPASKSHEVDIAPANEEPAVIEEEQEQKPLSASSSSFYSARLIRYQSPVLAQKFVEKLKKMGIDASIVKKINTAHNGKTIHWYQVVTKLYSSRQDLEKTVKMLEKSERLAHIIIDVHPKGNS